MIERPKTGLTRATLALARSHGAALLGVALAHQALLVCVVAPMTAFATARAITAATGSAAAVNSSLVRLVTSPASLLVIGVSALVSLSVQQLAAGAGAHIVVGGLGTLAALRAALRQLGGLLGVALWRYALTALYSLVPVVAALLAYAPAFGVRDPVAAYARGPRVLLTIGAVLAVVLLALWAYLSLRWVFATALFVDAGYRGRAALRRSQALTSGGWIRLGVAVAALGMGAVIAGAVLRTPVSNAATQLGPSAGPTVLTGLIGLNFALSLLWALGIYAAFSALVLAAYCRASRREPIAVESAGGRRRGWLAVALVALVAVFIGFAGVVWTLVLSSSPVDPSRVELIAHRAGEAHAPENTLAAVRRARSDRADRLEFDVQRTADDHLVVIHDADLVRLSGQDVSIAESTLQRVQSVDIGEGERVPTLEAFLDAAGDTPLALEIKTHPRDQQSTREIVELLRRRDAVPQTVVMSLDPQLTALAHSIEPKLATADLVSVAAGRLYLLPSDIIAPSDELISANLVFLAHAAGKRVWVWAVDDDELLRGAVRRGVDGVIVSDVPAARRVLEEMPTVSRADIVRSRVGEVMGALSQ